MTDVLIDTSILLKWFHSAGERDVRDARRIRSAHVATDIRANILDLGVYELGNVLGRSLRWPADRVAAELDDLAVLLGSPVPLTARVRRSAAGLADHWSLSYYDACWAATAVELGVPLVTADQRLLDAGLGATAATVADAWRLT